MEYRPTHSFHRARARADFEQVWARLTGTPIDLLAYDDVRRQLKAELTGRRNLREIPLDAIVGSVGRPGDFTRDFLPLNDRSRSRWSAVHDEALGSRGLPPIEVYQVGEAYFVLDGNHRVSVARDLGATHIEAYVTEVRSRVTLTPEADPRELILKARYVEFLERTELDELRPGANLEVTHLGGYTELERHINLHRYIMQVEQRREVAWPEAVQDWYDRVYLPVVHVIREQPAGATFPGRTEADIYLAVSGYRLLLDEQLDWEFDAAPAEADAEQPALPNLARGWLQRLRAGAPAGRLNVLPGEWRRQFAGALGGDFRLFTNSVGPVTVPEAGWAALELALLVARREHGRVLGLYVVAEASQATEPEAQQVRAEFAERCSAAGIAGRLAIDVGDVAERICARSGWVDITVVRLAYPPPAEPWAKLSSGFRTLVRNCASPLLAAPPGSASELKHALLAYNGSAKADSALQVAAYLAQHWAIALSVVTVGAGGFDAGAALDRARQQLEADGVTAAYRLETGPVAEIVLKQAAEQGCDFIITGGYGRGPFLEIALGSTVDHVLRRSPVPTLICP